MSRTRTKPQPSRRPRTTIMRLGAVLATAVGAVALAPSGQAATVPYKTPALQSAAVATTPCKTVTIPAALDDGTPTPLAGTLCTPAGATTVALLVHGATYDQYYFDLPGHPEYSTRADINNAGYATLNISRLGTGASAHPLSLAVNFDGQAKTVHDAVQALRNGTLGQQFSHVALVGHSYGSYIASREASRYRDVDVLANTGLSPHIQLTNVATGFVPRLLPTTLDPRLSKEHLDPGYVTTGPGGRTAFYNVKDVDPKILAEDEKLKGTLTLTDVATVAPQFLAPTDGHNINIPVLIMDGQVDSFMCGTPLGADCSSNDALARQSRPLYGPQAKVSAVVIPNTGHDLALERTAPTSNKALAGWLHTTLPPTTR